MSHEAKEQAGIVLCLTSRGQAYEHSYQPNKDNKRVMDLLRSYGKEFLVFDPDDQPNVFAEAEVRFPPARSGRVNPKQMKNWRHLPRMLQLLRDRYGLFRSGRLITDCPLFILKPRKSDDAKGVQEGLSGNGRQGAHLVQVPPSPILWAKELSCPEQGSLGHL